MSQDISVDFADDGFILGIEVRSFDKFTLAAARQYAERHDLAFPRDLSGILTP